MLTLLLAGACVGAQRADQWKGVNSIGSQPTPHTIAVTIKRGGIVDQVLVTNQGRVAQEFRYVSDSCRASFYYPGQSCTVDVGFASLSVGERRGAVVVLDRDKNILSTTFMVASASGSVTTFVPAQIASSAGNSAFLYQGDGVLATNTSLFLPYGVAMGTAGDLYIADTYNNRIRKVDATTNLISTVAGDGISGSSGDGGLATAAHLDNPSSVQIDSTGNLYISDTGNNTVRRVDFLTGLISTVAGVAGTSGFNGDSGPAIAATLNSPNGLSIDAAGNVYIADTHNNVIRFVNVATGIITTTAGTGTAGQSGDSHAATGATLNAPWSVFLSASGELYIADQQNNDIRFVSTAGIITTVAGKGAMGYSGDGGKATDALLNLPSAVALDSAGNLYISDTGNNRIRKINPVSQHISTIAGDNSTSFGPDGYPATQAALYGPHAILVDNNGDVVFADTFHNRIRKLLGNSAILYFPTLRVGGSSTPLNQVIENDGNTPLTIERITAGLNAAVGPNTTCLSGTILAPLEQCTIAAIFAPTTIGNSVQGTITIDSDAINTSSTLNLQGTVQSTDASTVLLSTTPNPSTFGNPVFLTVQALSPGVTPTGVTTILDGTQLISTLQLVNGVANVTLSALAVGQHNLTASYPGDVNNSASVSLPTLQVVNALPPNSMTAVALSSSANPIGTGQPLTLTALVTPLAAAQNAATGTVIFQDGGTTLGTSTLVAGTSVLSVSNLSPGVHTLKAVYNGDNNYATSTSPALIQVVTSVNPVTTVTLTSSADPIDLGSAVLISASVSAAAGNSLTPSGSVTFMEGATVLGRIPLSSGVASLSISTLAVGTHYITAVYGGDSTFSTSSSAVLTQIVVAVGSGNSSQFMLTVSPANLVLKSGTHQTLKIVITASNAFADTLALGCGGLPLAASCSFSQNTVMVTGGASKTLTVILDTGNPLGSGPTADVNNPLHSNRGGVLACMLPLGAGLFLLVGAKGRTRMTLTLLLSFGVAALLSGCGSSYTIVTTPTGSYTVQVFASGSRSQSNYSTPVTLTVTK